MFGADAAGQTTSDGRGTYGYTPTGLMATAALGSGLTVTHRYDPDDLRAVKVKEGKTYYYVHGLGGQLLAEYVEDGGQLHWTQDYVYAGSRLLASVQPNTIALHVGRVGQGTIVGTVDTATPIDCGEICDATFPTTTTVVLHATPAAGKWFGGWTGACAGMTPQTTVQVGGKTSCTAKFTDGPNLTVQTAGTGGATGKVIIYGDGDCRGECTVTRPLNTSVSLRAVHDAGALFAGWSGACAASGLTMGASVTLTDNTACTATFAPAYPFAKQTPAFNATLQGSVVRLS